MAGEKANYGTLWYVIMLAVTICIIIIMVRGACALSDGMFGRLAPTVTHEQCMEKCKEMKCESSQQSKK